MWRHAEGDNVAFLTQILEGERLVALMTINNKQPVTTYSLSLCMLDKVLQPCKTKLVCCPAILTNSYSPILRVVIPGLVMVLCLEDEEGWDRPPHRVDASNQRCPLTITRLNTKWLETSLRGCYYLNRSSNAYLEASLIKIIDVFI